MNRKFRRLGVALTSVSVLSLGLATAGLGSLPAGASTDPGVNTGTKTITIGATVPLSGLAALGFADVSKSAISVFNYVNAHGGVNGWKVNFIVKNDCYNLGICGAGNDTTSQTANLLNTSGGLFATVGSLGTATQVSVENTLKNAGVPQLFVNSGSHYWNNPSTYPGLYGFQTNYLAEGKMFATYIKATAALKSAKVGYLGQNDDFGQDGLQGLKNGGVTPNDSETYNATDVVFNQPTFKTTLAKFQSAGIKVVVLDTVPQGTTLALTAAKQLGYKPTFFISGVGSDPQTVNNANENGAYSMTFLPATKLTTNKWNAWTSKVLTAENGTSMNGVSAEAFSKNKYLNGNQQYGVAWSVAFLEALYKVTSSNGVPTRSGIESALTSTSFATPAVVPLAYSSTNHQGLTGGYLVKVSSASGAANQYTTAVNTTVYHVDPNSQALTTTKVSYTSPATWLH